MRTLLPLLLLVGCGDDGGTGISADAAIDSPGGSIDAATDAPPGVAMKITSTAYADGGVIPPAHVCASKGGMNLSPALTIANPPVGTASFAIVFTDITPNKMLVHSALYDIPAATLAIPTDVDKVFAPPDVAGAHQTNNYSGSRGYAGPCPPDMHTYQFKVYALSTATVPTAAMNTTKDQLVTLLATNLGTATLTATFTPP